MSVRGMSVGLLLGLFVGFGTQQAVAQQTLAQPAVDQKAQVLAESKRARMDVVIAKRASDEVRKLADTLAEYLGKMSDARFQVRTGDGKTGIAVGQAADFPALAIEPFGADKDPTRREDYLIQSHPGGLYLLGATDLAAQHAVWDLLYRLGHRQFFPGATWEVVPRLDTIRVGLKQREHPDYYSRRIWYGYGTWDYNGEPYQEWRTRNRMADSIQLSTGHAYDAIISRNAAEFKKHPEYLGLLGGVRKSTKFCVSNPGLRELIVRDALKQVEAKPTLQSISLEPSDGVGWCECPQCKAMGSPSTRALTLANLAAEALTKNYGDKFVGMYAYSAHSPPPEIDVHPRVVISVATAFVQGGFSVDELLSGWRKHKATLGIREYYSVNTWDRDLPGAARGGKLNYIKTTIPDFHARGARFFSSESSDNWGPNGLGYYIASRILWNVDEAKRVKQLREDFLDKAFGSARSTMADFYAILDGDTRPLLSDDLLGRMYRMLETARGQTDNDAVQRRLHDLVLYTRYVELYYDYANLQGDARQAAFEQLIRHAYRMRKTMMIHTKALYRDLVNRDRSVTIPANAKWSVPEAKNPWKDSKPFAKAEIDSIVKAGIARRALLAFTPVSYSDELVPATKLKLPAVKDGSFGGYHRGESAFLTWADKAPARFPFKATAGVIYKSRGPAEFSLFPVNEPEGKSVANAEAPPDRIEHEFEAKSAFAGLHRLVVSDRAQGTKVSFPQGMIVCVRSTPEDRFRFYGRWTLYFYVPRGTKIVGGFSGNVGRLCDGTGKVVHEFDRKPGYFSVNVPAGQDGTLWKFDRCAGPRYLMTVPPYLARNGQELLLPREVVAKDAAAP